MILALVLLALAVAFPALANPVDPGQPTTDSFVFHGCAISPNIENWTVTSHWTVMINAFTSWEACQAKLASISRPDTVVYAWWFPGEPIWTATWCGLSINPPDITYSSLYDGNCPVGYAKVGVQKDFTVNGAQSDYQFAGCYADLTQSNPPGYLGDFYNGGVNSSHLASVQPQEMMTSHDCLAGCASEFAGWINDNPSLFTTDLYGYALHYAPGAPEVTARGGANCICALDTVHGILGLCEYYQGGTSTGGGSTGGGSTPGGSTIDPGHDGSGTGDEGSPGGTPGGGGGSGSDGATGGAPTTDPGDMGGPSSSGSGSDGSPGTTPGGNPAGSSRRRDVNGADVSPSLRRRDAPFTMAYVYAMLLPQILEPSAAPVRRRAARAKQLALQEAKQHAYCPRGLTPCHVSPRSKGYECLDVTSELESCGGCRWGVYGNASSAAVGFDCTRRRGVDSAATSCVRGKCTVWGCRAGFKLAGGECTKV
ncbi:Protein priA [Vanrija pseudolonga]|uniref:Protein priA n=1 Tax=Vanrija pseudolonga TaxID=143232 RepID=A0AAF0Y4Q5_9TREE|nr:Protein priA [Vanrija pseudolonga]